MIKKKSISCCLYLLLVAVAVSSTQAGNWPSWRGTEGTGISPDKDVPLKWSKGENVRRRADLPGPCNSSPIVWGDRVFLTQTIDDGNHRTVMCFDRANGKLLWQSGVVYSEKERTRLPHNPYCSATPVTDGERVIASFGSAGLYCYDFAGKELWHRDFGKMDHMFGNASSVILYGDLCILPFGPDDKARLIAVNKRTGETVWEVEPPIVDLSEQQSFGGPGPGGGPSRPDARRGLGGPGDPGRPREPGGPGGRPGPDSPGGPGGPQGRGNPTGTWSTPIIVKANGHDELIMAFPYRLAAYDPKTGKQLWLSKGIGATVYATPVWCENTIVAMSSGMGRGSVVAVKLGGSGDVTESRRLWQAGIKKSRTGSGIIHEGHFYNISDNGIADCEDLKTGKTVWEERLKGPGAKSNSWSSMLLADGNIYVPNQSGDVFVLRASPQFELIATNSVGESSNASLAASDGELFMRTDKSLWCFAKTP